MKTSPPLATFDQFVQMLVLLGVGSDEVPLWSAAVQQLRRAPGPRPVSAAAPNWGLAAYQAEDAEVFFGREDLTERLLAEVASGRSTPLVVLGASGSGKSSLGTTPSQWLVQERILAARELLEESRLGVGPIAHRVGFGSSDLLRKHFAAHVGVAPSRYRVAFALRTGSGIPGRST